MRARRSALLLRLLLAALAACSHWHSAAALPPGNNSVARIHKVGYVKTHKTGSTTLGAALFRFGARNHLRFYCQGVGPQPCRRAHIVWPGRPLQPGQVYDLQLNHFSGNGVLRQSFGHVIAWYKRMLGVDPDAVESPPPWALIVPVREPVSHYLSWYNYFAEPDLHLSVQQWVRTRRSANGLAAEFGLRSVEDVTSFLEVMAWGVGGDVGAPALGGATQLWLPMERFADGMLLLRRTLGWSLLDVTYAVMFDSRQEHASRWDGKLIKPTPKAASLSKELVDSIKALNHLDGRIYDQANKLFDGALAAARGRPGSAARAAWNAEREEFTRMQAALAASFNSSARVGACGALRAWYTLSDVSYEGKIDARGHAVVPPEATEQAMLAAYERSGKTRFC